MAVINAKFIVLLSDKKVEDTTAGITSNSTKGLVIPPVKKDHKPSILLSLNHLINFFFL